jgi:hypothetical protein
MDGGTEALVIINGHALTQAQALTLRVALDQFALALLDDELGAGEPTRATATAYLARIAEIRDFLHAGER